MSPNFAQCVVLLWIRLIQPIWFASDILWYSVRITPPCPRLFLSVATRFLEKGEFSDRFYRVILEESCLRCSQILRIEGNLRCSKILRIGRKNPMKKVVSISRDYWVYLDITWQSFKIWEFWGEFWGIETFHRSKFSPATGVRNMSLGKCPKIDPAAGVIFHGKGCTCHVSGGVWVNHQSPSKFTHFCLGGLVRPKTFCFLLLGRFLFREQIWVIIEFRSSQLRPSQMGNQ